MAWYAIGIKGILSYIFIHTTSKLVVSNFAKRNTIIANFAYRNAALFQTIACIGNLIVVHEGSQLSEFIIATYSAVVLPALLGSYEGAYWASYHGINRVPNELKRLDKLLEKKQLSIEHHRALINSPMTLEYEGLLETIPAALPPPKRETDAAYSRGFQLNEVLATVTIALAVYFSSTNYPDSWDTVANVLTLMVTCLALFWPFDNRFRDLNGQPKRKDRSPLPHDKNARTKGKMITGNFGIMQFSVNWAMKIFALRYGGIATLSLYVALAEFSGFFLADILHRLVDQKEFKLRNRTFIWPGIKSLSTFLKQSRNIWLLGHSITIIGVIFMATGAIIASSVIFLGGWLFSQGAIRGMMRGRELEFANVHLNPDPSVYCGIGLRERLKFWMQFQYVLVILICYYFHTFIDISPELWVISILLFWAAFTALIGLALIFPKLIGVDLLTRQQDSHMD
jgi:hypothetical protein